MYPREVKLSRFTNCQHIVHETLRRVKDELQLCFGDITRREDQHTLAGISDGDEGWRGVEWIFLAIYVEHKYFRHDFRVRIKPQIFIDYSII